MEMVTEYIFKRNFPKREPLPFPRYLYPQNRYVNHFWITRDGACVYPHEMTDRHLVNTIRLIHRNDPYLEDLYNDVFNDIILFGPIYNHNDVKCITKKQLSRYNTLWEQTPLYMLLRRELKLRRLEDHL